MTNSIKLLIKVWILTPIQKLHLVSEYLLFNKLANNLIIYKLIDEYIFLGTVNGGLGNTHVNKSLSALNISEKK